MDYRFFLVFMKKIVRQIMIYYLYFYILNCSFFKLNLKTYDTYNNMIINILNYRTPLKASFLFFLSDNCKIILFLKHEKNDYRKYFFSVWK